MQSGSGAPEYEAYESSRAALEVELMGLTRLRFSNLHISVGFSTGIGQNGASGHSTLCFVFSLLRSYLLGRYIL